MQANIFEITKPRFYFDRNKKIKVFEAFSGVGMQRMALNRLNIKYECVGYSEIDKYAIQSYQSIHDDYNNYGDITKIKGNDLAQLDLFTYSFPCQDLSIAGKQKGLNNTRSGLVYEVLRILKELNYNDRPKVLLMENVSALVQKKFINQFNEIQLELEELGYTNHIQVINALNYGIAQNRERVFMVSILGDYYYEFPKPIPLEKKLKDYLQPINKIDKKYFLSDKQIDAMKNSVYESMSIGRVNRVDDIYNCITTMQGGAREPKIFAEGIIIPEAIKRGYSVAYEGDSVNLEHPNSTTRRGRVGKQQAQTLTTSCNQGVVNNDYTIRKLTPLECWRLMGIDDKCFEKAKCVCSNSQLYKQAGNGIVVNVLIAIFKNLYEEETEE